MEYRVLDIARAHRAYSWSPERFNVWSTAQRFLPSTGLGTLEGSRGSMHVTMGKVVLRGENDIFGAFSTKKWAAASALQKSWSGGSWMGNDWTSTGYGSGLLGMSSWTGRSWLGRSWSGRSWSGNSWTSVSWQGSAGPDPPLVRRVLSH